VALANKSNSQIYIVAPQQLACGGAVGWKKGSRLPPLLQDLAALAAPRNDARQNCTRRTAHDETVERWQGAL